MVDKNEVVRLYASGKTLRECAVVSKISMQRVHQILKQVAPEIIKPPYKPYRKPEARP